MEQQMEEIHEKLDKKLNANTQVLQKLMTYFIEQMSNLKSSVFMEQETNIIKLDKSCSENSAGSKRSSSLEDTGNSNLDNENMSGRRKSLLINPPSQQNLQKGIAK